MLMVVVNIVIMFYFKENVIHIGFEVWDLEWIHVLLYTKLYMYIVYAKNFNYTYPIDIFSVPVQCSCSWRKTQS